MIPGPLSYRAFRETGPRHDIEYPVKPKSAWKMAFDKLRERLLARSFGEKLENQLKDVKDQSKGFISRAWVLSLRTGSLAWMGSRNRELVLGCICRPALTAIPYPNKWAFSQASDFLSIHSVPSQMVHDAFDCQCLLQSITQPDRYV